MSFGNNEINTIPLRIVMKISPSKSKHRSTLFIIQLYKHKTHETAKTTRKLSSEMCTLNTKFHYAVWFEAGSKLVADLQRAEIWPI